MRYAVADATTCRILRQGQCNPVDLAAQALAGQAALDISAYPDWIDDERLYQYVEGAMTARPAMTASLPATAGVGAAVALTGLPAGAAIIVDGVDVGTADATGAASLTFADAGSYAVSVSLWPWLDLDGEVVAS